MGQGGQRHTSRATRAWLRSLTPGVGLSAGGSRCGQLKQSGVLGLGRMRALAGPDCEWERAVHGVLLGRSNRQGGKCVAADWAAWVGAAGGLWCWLSTRREATGRGMCGWSEALTGGPAGCVRVGVATLVCGPSWSDGEGARAMLMLALASWDHRAEGKRAFADCWRGARFGESARGIGPTWAAEERVWADFGSLG